MTHSLSAIPSALGERTRDNFARISDRAPTIMSSETILKIDYFCIITLFPAKWQTKKNEHRIAALEKYVRRTKIIQKKKNKKRKKQKLKLKKGKKN